MRIKLPRPALSLKTACLLFLSLQLGLSGLARAVDLTLSKATELRADKLANAKVLQSLTAAMRVRLISSEGGWALIEVPTTANKSSPDKSMPAMTGWIRANALNWQAESSGASTLSSGREVAGNTALTLGVRSLAPRANRHALIIGVSQYADPAIPKLPGVRIDRESATQMAHSMQIPDSNIRYLEDSEATGDGIRKAIGALTERVEPGDRVFIHYSGHGTRYADSQNGGCTEALLAYDGAPRGLISNREMVSLMAGITNKTDKLFVMYDACHSGGVAESATTARTRSLVTGNDEGVIRPKFVNLTEECGKVTNVKTRNLMVEITAKGAQPQDIIHLSAARDDEISFDDENKGGLATQYMRDCMLRDARDLNNTGAITMEDIRQCAQEKIDRRMAGNSTYQPHHLVLNGNAGFVPAWFDKTALAPVTTGPVSTPPVNTSPVNPAPSPTAPTQAAAQTQTQTQAQTQTSPPAPTQAAAQKPAPAAPATQAPPSAQPAQPTPKPVSGRQALAQVFDQRDSKHKLTVSVSRKTLKIGRDALGFDVQTDRPGYLYVALAGSDNQSVYLLFPNDLDKDNRITPGQTLHLPRPQWEVKAAGPAGVDHLLVMVADAPRDLQALNGRKAGPFITSLNNAEGRAQLGALLTNAQDLDTTQCIATASRVGNRMCSDAFGAYLFDIQETN